MCTCACSTHVTNTVHSYRYRRRHLLGSPLIILAKYFTHGNTLLSLSNTHHSSRGVISLCHFDSTFIPLTKFPRTKTILNSASLTYYIQLASIFPFTRFIWSYLYMCTTFCTSYFSVHIKQIWRRLNLLFSWLSEWAAFPEIVRLSPSERTASHKGRFTSSIYSFSCLIRLQ